MLRSRTRPPATPPVDPQSSVLLESTDVARLLGVTPNHVRIMARFGHLRPRYTTPRGARLFATEDVLQLRAQRERKKGRR